MGRYIKMAAAGLLCIAIVLVSLIVWLNLYAFSKVSDLALFNSSNALKTLF